jgi:2-haloacid dehalogenase
MGLDRRMFLRCAAAGAVGAFAVPSFAAPSREPPAIRALAFDAFPVFDPRPFVERCERLFPGHGQLLADLWRTRQFEYQWLRALGGTYADFWSATQDALEFAADALKLPLTLRQRDSLMQGYRELTAWPDAKPALEALRARGLGLALLSNATPEILECGIQHADLEGIFDHVVSTDRIRSFKPDPRAYALGVSALGVAKEEILFVAAAGWDVAGATWFGYPTFWNNRQDAAAERLDAAADGHGATLTELVAFVARRSRA